MLEQDIALQMGRSGDDVRDIERNGRLCAHPQCLRRERIVKT